MHITRTPCQPGLDQRAQNRVGRAELLSTSFETFERRIRDQLGRTLGPGGFGPATDITAVTVNRWPHGYAYEYNPLFDPDWDEHNQPHVIGRQPFGRITIATASTVGDAWRNSSAAAVYSTSSCQRGQTMPSLLIGCWAGRLKTHTGLEILDGEAACGRNPIRTESFRSDEISHTTPLLRD